MADLVNDVLIFMLIAVGTTAMFILWLWWQNRSAPYPESESESAKKGKSSTQPNLEEPPRNLTLTGSEEISIPLSASRRIRMVIEETGVGDTSAQDPVRVEIKIHTQSNAPLLERLFLAFKKFFSGIQSLISNKLLGDPKTLNRFLLVLIITLYLLTRFNGIKDYPIYFFSDEAVQTNQAADLVKNGFKGFEDTFLPTYFKNGERFNLSASVYVQVIPQMLFGKSIEVTRGTSILITSLAVLFICLILKNHFKLKYWWLGGLFLSISPAWFLHSRTAFETTLAVTAFTGFLYYYLGYRLGNPKQLYKALFFGAAMFYAYNPGRVVIVATGLALLLIDARYHWEHRKTALRGGILLLVLAAPFLRFQISFPTENTDHLRSLASYWMQPIPNTEKLGLFLKEYLSGLDPGYWFIANPHDLPRHQMGNYPHMLTVLLPIFIIGIGISLYRIKKPEYRILLAGLLIAPLGGALVDIGITRCLAFLIPAVSLSTIGLEWAVSWIPSSFAYRKAVPVGLFALTGIFNVYLMDTALTEGTFWNTNYGMGGMQYGAEVLMETLDDLTAQHPDKNFLLTPSWANGPEEIARFWFNDEIPFNHGSIDGYINNLFDDIDTIIFISVPEELSRVLESEKFTAIDILHTIPYPDGASGFIFYTLTYVDEIEDILISEFEERRELVEDQVEINGVLAVIRHSMLDMGAPDLLFDDDTYSLARTVVSNPFLIELSLEEPITFNQFEIIIGSSEVIIEISFRPEDVGTENVLIFTGKGSVDHPNLKFDLPEEITTDYIYISVLDKHQGEPGNMHIWEITLK